MDTTFCIYCGARLTGAEAFCPRCGKAISPPAAAPSATPTAPPQPYAGTYQQQAYPPQGYAPQQGAVPQQGGGMPPFPTYGQPPAQAPYRAQYAAPDKTKRRRTAGLIGFVILAVLVVLLFLLMKVSVLWTAAALVILLALCLLQWKLAAKGWVSGILLLLAGAALSFAVLVVGMQAGGAQGSVSVPSAPQHAAVRPSSSETVVEFGQVRVVIPGGTVSEEETLTLEKKEGLPPPIKELEPLTPAFDVSLGGLTSFNDPILIEIPYDASKIGKDDPSGGFLAMYYDEETKLWDAVPCEIDPDAGVVRLTMYHLTTVQCYYSAWKRGNVYDNGTVSVIYLRTGNTENLAKYEEAVGEPTGDGKTPRFVEDVAKNATDILNAYKKLGLEVPDHPCIYVTAEKNNYNSLTGNVCMSLDIAIQADPEKAMLRNLAHELFHTAQQATLGTVYYQATKGQNIDFWMEAAADYMGNTGVWEALGQPAVNEYEYYGAGFFDTGLFAVNGSHEYDAASFVKFVQDAQPASPLQLVNMASSLQAFQDSFASVYGKKYESLLGAYEEFMEYSLFDNGARFLAKDNAALLKSIPNRKDIAFELDENGDAKPGAAPVEGSGSLTFKDQYTAGFYVFTANCDTTLTITPDAPVRLYVGSVSRSGRGFETRIDAVAGQPAEVGLTKDSFLLVARVSAAAGASSFTYKALPTPADLTGQWACTQLEYTDCEGDDAFWAAVGEGLGYDKSGYLAASNDALQQQGGSFYMTFTGGDGSYTVTMSNTGQAEILTFTDVTVDGSTVVCKENFDGLWGTLTLTLGGDGRTMTGTLRAQTVYHYGDASYLATDVMAITAVREETPAE